MNLNDEDRSLSEMLREMTGQCARVQGLEANG